jgi:aryl-alcohol dehydrogenase-like predicted oxidoreductase
VIARRRIGSLEVSELGLGCYFGRRLDFAQFEPVVHAALDAGINFFDTADIYGEGDSEQFLGRALTGRRDRAVIATKFAGGTDDASPATVRRSVEESLRRLGVDVIDLYQLHRPHATPMEETLEALDGLVRDGKVREIGCSNLAAWQLVDAHWLSHTRGWSRFCSAQNRYSLLDRSPERELIPACRHLDTVLIPHTPLHSGLLTGKYSSRQPPPEGSRMAGNAMACEVLNDRNLALVERLRAFAAERGTDLVGVAIGFLLSRTVVAAVIPAATSPEQVVANVRSARWRVSDEDLQTLEEITVAAT